MVAAGAQIAIRDGTWLWFKAVKSPIRERNERIADIAQSLVLMGAAIYIMMDRGNKGCCTTSKKADTVDSKNVSVSENVTQGKKAGKKGGKK